MVEKYSCEKCNKGFGTAEALAMHAKAKHPEEVKKPVLSIAPKTKKRIRNWGIAVLVLGLLVWGITALMKDRANTAKLEVSLSGENLQNIPMGAIHWHPKLTIKINGERVPIPPDIGIRIGRVVDPHLSGMQMSPTHTHESDGTIHVENQNPSIKPETLTLGYFFYVWGKHLNSSCIFEYCTDKGTLKIYVNEQENLEFENYLMKDKDDILIEYHQENEGRT